MELQLPKHLQKYVVQQNYEKYTPVDQACWRFIMRQLKSFLTTNAHECYSEGLEKTGIEIERIPRIEDISKKLQEFGWHALPVSGFIPPAAFMELQSLGVLPIASDMRTLDHLLYTPAPDIVHEAAGHAPILIHPEFAGYLQQYAQVAKRAIISREDLDLYEAIRNLSDVKENPSSTSEEIAAAQTHLEKVSHSMTHVSEAAELARMNWWTAEYGLIGSLENPKLYGAGLLSSVGESRWCLNKKVKKIPLTVDCIQTGYDITEPQPQLFVTPDFKNLSKVLDQMANKMAFRTGGLEGIKKAIKAATVNTAELNSGVQLSGQMADVITTDDGHSPIYLKLQGSSQVAYNDQELPGHGTNYHKDGYSTPIGFFKGFAQRCPSLLSDEELGKIGIKVGERCLIEMDSGIRIEGFLKNRIRQDGKLILITFENCKVAYFGRVLFEPTWGVFDMVVGSRVTSVFGGPADRETFGDTDDFVAKRVPLHRLTSSEKLLHQQYANLRLLREQQMRGEELSKQLLALLAVHEENFPKDWLFRVEVLELVLNRLKDEALAKKLKGELSALAQTLPEQKEIIEDGVALAARM